jgi:hypothetical protein
VDDATREPVAAATHRRLAVDLYNGVMSLLERDDRTPSDDDELVHAAHASRWHWGRVGNAANLARGEWLCSRVYATLGLGEAAVRHAERCLALVGAGGEGFEDWDHAAALEAVARARLAAGDVDGARRSLAGAAAATVQIADSDDRAVLEGDLAGLATLLDRA